MNQIQIVLCSASPRRQQLLKELGFEFEILVKDVDESFPAHIKAENVAAFLADKKSEAFRTEFEDRKIYITADTIVSLTPTLSKEEGEVLNKPADAEEAFSMLKKLSGNIHQVYSGVCLAGKTGKKLFSVRSEVSFKKLHDDEIKYYIEHYKPFDKAGAYGAQECLPEGMNPCSKEEREFLKAINKPDLFERTLSKNKERFPIIRSIEGSYFNVMGLPVVEVYQAIISYEY